MLSNKLMFSERKMFSPFGFGGFGAFGAFGLLGALVTIVQLLALVAILTWASVASAQEVPQASAAPAYRGVVRDARTGRPVEGATVYAVGADTQAATKADGSFVLVGDTITAVTVISDDYAPTTVKLGAEAAAQGEPAVVQVELEPLAFDEQSAAEVIAVQGDRPPAAPGATTVRRAEITRIPGTRGDTLSGLKNLPGVANNGSLTPGSGGLIIRGSSPEDSRILVDGFEIPILYHFLGVQSVLPSEMIDNVEYLPGAYGPSYGRASGGVVAVTSRHGAGKTGGFAELSFLNAAGLVEGRLGKRGSFAVAARRSIIDAILPAVIPSSANLAFTAYPRYYDYQAQAEYALSDRWQLRGFLFGSDDQVVLLNDNDNALDPAATGRFANAASFTRAISSLSYRRPELSAKLSVSAYTDTNHFSVGADRFLRLDRDGVAGRAEATWNASPRLALNAGAEADLTRTRFDIKFTRPPREGDPMAPNFSQDALLQTKGATRSPDLGAWIGATAWPVRTLELNMGARVDHYVRNQDVALQPRAQAAWQIADGSMVRAAAGMYTRPPEDLDENLQDSLQAEHAIHGTVSAERRLMPGLTAQATGFYNRLSDLVVLDGNRREMSSLDGYVNRGVGRAYGAELLLRLRRDDFFGWISYTGSRATRRDAPSAPQRLFDYDQSHNLIAVASWNLTPKWQLGGRFQLTTGKPYTPVTSAVYQADVDAYLPQYGEVNSRRVNTQHQLDLRVDRTWSFRSWKLAGYVDIANTYLNAAVVDYAYNFDYTARQNVTTLPIIPSIGLRGEM
jgi:TonB-dependent Receptor Plug Domain